MTTHETYRKTELTLIVTCSRHAMMYTGKNSAVGDPSKGQLISTIMAYESSGAMTTRSGLLLPDVPGRGCSLYLAPRESGTALMILSRIALCLSHIRPRLGWQWFSTCTKVSWNLPHTRHSVDGTIFLQRACTVLEGGRV